MAAETAGAFLETAKRALEAGDVAAATLAVKEGHSRWPDHADLRLLYQGLHLAAATKLATGARLARRDALTTGSATKDGGEFAEALRHLELVLAEEPRHPKALLLKAGVLFRQDRQNRAAAVALIQEALKVEPGPNLERALRAVAEPCRACGDTGLCAECGGTGEVRRMFVRGKCMTCFGKGMCKRCWIL